ncbi:MAG: restriction endonuclease subunit S [Phycisphaerales bacterium]|nr:restriction endonuclease subunit S [Phycisphaerales bacterium]
MSAIIDYRGKTPQKVSFGVPLITAKIVKGGRILDAEEFIAESDYVAWMRRGMPLPGDVVVTTEAPLGEVAQLDDRKIALAQRLIGLRGKPDRLDNTFLRFAMQAAIVQDQLASRASGTTVLGIRQAELRHVEIPLPPLPEQRAIARVLGGLDDKIELNRRMNRTLEDLARGVFRSWFVDFDPVTKPSRGFAGPSKGLAGSGSPGPSSGGGSVPLASPSAGAASPSAGAAPADLFPKRLVDSPLGPIPEGWRVGTVGEIGTNPRRGVLPSEVDATTPYIGLEHMPRRCIALDDWGTAADVSSGKSRFARGEILFGKLRPYFHKVGVALIDGVCSTDVIVAAPKKECWFGVLLGHLSSDEFIDYVDGASGGTRMPRTGWGDMARYQIVIPPEPIVASYSAWMRQVAEMLRNHAHESRSLAALRDALLPQLLSGEIRLREADRAVDDALRSNSPLPRAGGNKRPRAGMAAGTSKGRA